MATEAQVERTRILIENVIVTVIATMTGDGDKTKTESMIDPDEAPSMTIPMMINIAEKRKTDP